VTPPVIGSRYCFEDIGEGGESFRIGIANGSMGRDSMIAEPKAIFIKRVMAVGLFLRLGLIRDPGLHFAFDGDYRQANSSGEPVSTAPGRQRSGARNNARRALLAGPSPIGHPCGRRESEPDR
jgi:hypothetical protein